MDKAPKTYLASVDGLRGVAVLAVLVVHGCQVVQENARGHERALFDQTYDVWSLGRTGVQLFFVLSGFLLFRPYARAVWAGAKWPPLTRFLTNRLRRVGPAYWTATVVLAFAVGAQWWDVLLHIFFVHNLTPTTFRSINGVFWSMAVEVQFYVLLPLLAMFLRRWRWAGLMTLLGVSGVTQVVMLSLEKHGVGEDWLRSVLSLPLYLSVFVCGMVVAAVHEAKPEWRSKRLAIPGLVVLLVLMTYEVTVDAKIRLFAISWDSGLGLGFASLLWLALVSPVVGKMFGGRWIIAVGIISYSAYIWHLPLYQSLLATLIHADGGRFAALSWLALVAAVILPLSWLSYRFLEKPFHAHPSAGRSSPTQVDPGGPIAVLDQASMLSRTLPRLGGTNR